MKNVLVVDGDKDLVNEICLHLAPYKSLQATSGQMALEMARIQRPDLILMNPGIPGMDGFYVLDQLKCNYQLKNIPVVLLTSDDSPDFQVKWLKSGVVDFILLKSNYSRNQILDWEILKHRLNMHLELAEYRLSLEHSVTEMESNIGLCFAELIECKDHSFSGHVMRTERYAELLALSLYKANYFPAVLNLNYIEDLCKAVPFHDIGKIGISEQILCKRGPLNNEELKTARSHTTIGAQMLDDIYLRIPERSYFKFAGIIARSHHEHFDGKGYPDGLYGEDIPLACRIVSVVNVYDACANERVYHPAMSHEDACQEIIKGNGTEFDPRIVDVFFQNKNEFAMLAEELKVLTGKLGKLPAFLPTEAELPATPTEQYF